MLILIHIRHHTVNVAAYLSTYRQVKERKPLQSARVSTVYWECGSTEKRNEAHIRKEYGVTAPGVRFQNEDAEFICEMKSLNQVHSKKWVRSMEQ